MKKPFSIDYREKIEKGKYKVVTCDERDAKIDILSWNADFAFPIVATINGKAFNFTINGTSMNGDRNLDLFVITDYSELTENEKSYAKLRYNYNDKDINNLNCEQIKKIKSEWACILVPARKELEGSIRTEINKELQSIRESEYNKGCSDALKTVPKWKHISAGAGGNGEGIDAFLIRVGINSYRLSSVICGGDDYIELSELEKLPKLY